MSGTTRLDVIDYLDTEERQVAYITAALETGDGRLSAYAREDCVSAYGGISTVAPGSKRRTAPRS